MLHIDFHGAPVKPMEGIGVCISMSETSMT